MTSAVETGRRSPIYIQRERERREKVWIPSTSTGLSLLSFRSPCFQSERIQVSSVTPSPGTNPSISQKKVRRTDLPYYPLLRVAG